MIGGTDGNWVLVRIFFQAFKEEQLRNRTESRSLYFDPLPLWQCCLLADWWFLGKQLGYHCTYSLKCSYHLYLCHPNNLLLKQLPTVIGKHGSRKPKFSEWDKNLHAKSEGSFLQTSKSFPIKAMFSSSHPLSTVRLKCGRAATNSQSFSLYPGKCPTVVVRRLDFS